MLSILFVIIGTLIGAGFASGREIYVFFFRFGRNGIYGLIISAIFMSLIIYKTFKIILENKIENYDEFLNIITKKTKFKFIGRSISIIINMFILICFFVMIAGFGAYFAQELGIPKICGSIIISILCYIVFLKNVEGIIKVNDVLIPIIIIFIVFMGIKCSNNIIDYQKTNIGLSGWFKSSILYTSYNSIILIPILVSLKNFLKNKKQNFIICFMFFLAILILAFSIYGILCMSKQDLRLIELPAIYVVGKISNTYKKIYGIIIIIAIFTSAISTGYAFLNNVLKHKKNKIITAILCILGVLLSNIGFAKLVDFLYPIFGYLGLLQIFLIMLEKKGKN